MTALSPRYLTIPEAVDYVVVHHAHRLHEGVADGGADEPNPRSRRSLLIASDSFVRAGIWDMNRYWCVMVLPSTNRQLLARVAKDGVMRSYPSNASYSTGSGNSASRSASSTSPRILSTRPGRDGLRERGARSRMGRQGKYVYARCNEAKTE